MKVMLPVIAGAALLLSMSAFAAQHMPAEQYVHESGQVGTLTPQGAVSFKGARIKIPVIAVEPGKPDTTFEVHGKVNPTLIVPAGAKLRFALANADGGMPHGLDVTVSGPPYGQMPHLPMMKMPGHGGMMNSPRMREKIVASTDVVDPNSGDKKQLAVRETGWFTLKPGVYYYVCPIPGHAKQGMYGKIIAR